VTLGELEAAMPPRLGEVPAEQAGEGDPVIQPARERYAALDALLVDTGAALSCLPQVQVADDTASRIRLGNSVIIRGRDAPVEAEEACVTARGRLVAIGGIEAGMFHPKRVFTG
jgi:tRNA pseudouridine55 synthase